MCVLAQLSLLPLLAGRRRGRRGGRGRALRGLGLLLLQLLLQGGDLAGLLARLLLGAGDPLIERLDRRLNRLQRVLLLGGLADLVLERLDLRLEVVEVVLGRGVGRGDRQEERRGGCQQGEDDGGAAEVERPVLLALDLRHPPLQALHPLDQVRLRRRPLGGERLGVVFLGHGANPIRRRRADVPYHWRSPVPRPATKGEIQMPEAVIVDTIRTPIGRAFKGSLAQVRPDEMGAFVVDTLLDRNPEVDPALVEELYCGVGLPQGLQGFNLARIMVLLSEKLPLGVNGATVSRYCASSLEAIRQAANAVVAGQGDAYIAAGVEWVSRYNEAVEGARPQDQNEKLQGGDGRPDAYISMGMTAENVAERYEVSRADMDKYAQRSQELAVQSQESGYFDREIVSVTLEDGTVVSRDDGPRASSTLEKLAELDPAFKEGGKVTAGNSCPLNDGAAAVLVMSDTKASELGLRPRARIVASATAANEPEYMGVAPIWAIKKVLERAGMSIDDVDTVELNEAFAAQVIPIMAECDIPLEKLNPHGGAIALGHPFGMTGARIMTTLLNGLESDDKTIGLETMCVAGGQGQAMVVERLN